MKTTTITVNKVKMNRDLHVGVLWGITGGMAKYLLWGGSAEFLVKLIGAAATAFVCGIVGAAGKQAYDILKNKFKKKLKK